MTPAEQLEKWVKGENVHNHERGECCPDFACCSPNNHFPIELREKFAAAYRDGGSEACLPFLLMALSGAVIDSGVDVHVAGLNAAGGFA